MTERRPGLEAIEKRGMFANYWETEWLLARARRADELEKMERQRWESASAAFGISAPCDRPYPRDAELARLRALILTARDMLANDKGQPWTLLEEEVESWEK